MITNSNFIQMKNISSHLNLWRNLKLLADFCYISLMLFLQRKNRLKGGFFYKKNFGNALLSQPLSLASTLGTGALHCCVRNGNRCYLSAIITKARVLYTFFLLRARTFFKDYVEIVYFWKRFSLFNLFYNFFYFQLYL